jgi:hypothetical protein
MTNQLAIIEPEQFETTQRVAKAMVASGYFQDAKEVGQAVVKIMAGQEMGLPPFAAMTSIHIIKGKPVLGANALATLVKGHPFYDYKIKKLDGEGCVIAFFENGKHVGDSSFTADDATAAGLAGGNWQKVPRNMYFARAMSNGAKWFAPGIFGGAPVYTPDEFDISVDDGGEIIDVTPAIIEPEDVDIEDGVTVEEADKSEPLPDDERAIFEAPASEFMKLVIEFIPRYDNAPHVKGALKQLGYTGVPLGNGEKALERLEMYRNVKLLATARDAEEAKKGGATGQAAPIFPDKETTGGGAFVE